MSLADKFKKSDLEKRVKESFETKDSSGKFKSFFKEDIKDAKYWKCSEGPHELDIVPYFAGNNDPSKSIRPGDATYVLDLWIHDRVGVNEDNYVCLARNYGRPCPICEHQRNLRSQDDFDEQLVKSLTPKRRAIYNIICYDNDKETEKGVQIWNSAHWNTEQYILELARSPRHGGVDTSFADPSKEGKSIKFTRTGTGPTNTRFLGHAFLSRDYSLPDEVLEAAHVLDEIIHIPSYEEVYEAFFQERYAGETVQEPVPEQTRSKTFSRPTARKEAVEEPNEKPIVDVPDFDTNGSQCPTGYVFGESIDKYSECESCGVWNECAKEQNRLLHLAKPEIKEPVKPTAVQNPRKFSRRA